MTMIPKWFHPKFYLFYMSSFLLISCGSIASFEIYSDVKANNNSAIQVDIVLITTQELYDKVSVLTAAEWFKQRKQIMYDAANKYKALSVTSREVMPGQQLEVPKIQAPWGLKGVLVFANYQTPGPHRIALQRLNDAVIILGKEDFTVSSKKKGK